MIKSKPIVLISTLLTAAALIGGCASRPYQESTGQFIDSSVITAKVKAKLINDEGLKSLPITVKTYKGTVQLSGFVNNNRQRLRAGADARSVPGVVSVQNLLVIKSR